MELAGQRSWGFREGRYLVCSMQTQDGACSQCRYSDILGA